MNTSSSLHPIWFQVSFQWGMQWRAERTFIATLGDRTGVGFLLETLNGREKWSHPPLSHALQCFGSTSTLSNTVRGRNNGVCFPSINSAKKFCQDMFHFTLRAWLSLQSEECVKWHCGRQRGEKCCILIDGIWGDPGRWQGGLAPPGPVQWQKLRHVTIRADQLTDPELDWWDHFCWCTARWAAPR